MVCVIDENSRVWLGYFNQGVDIYDEKKNALNLSKVFQTKINLFTQNLLPRLPWIMKTVFGLELRMEEMYNSKTQEFTHLIDQKTDCKRSTSSDIVSVFIDSKGNVWVGT